MSWIVRNESPGDLAAIDDIHRAAFADDPHSQHNEHAIVRALRTCGSLRVSLVAEVDGQVVGHIAVSPVAISDGTANWYGLGPIAVSPRHQKKGIGQRLVSETLYRVRESGGAGCVLLGEPSFYGRFGFEPCAALILAGVPPAYFQALRFSGVMPRGEVTYHPSFGGGIA